MKVFIYEKRGFEVDDCLTAIVAANSLKEVVSVLEADGFVNMCFNEPFNYPKPDNENTCVLPDATADVDKPKILKLL